MFTEEAVTSSARLRNQSSAFFLNLRFFRRMFWQDTCDRNTADCQVVAMAAKLLLIKRNFYCPLPIEPLVILYSCACRPIWCSSQSSETMLGSVIASPKFWKRSNILTLSGQQYFVWDIASQSTKRQDILEIFLGEWPLCSRGYAYVVLRKCSHSVARTSVASCNSVVLNLG